MRRTVTQDYLSTWSKVDLVLTPVTLTTTLFGAWLEGRLDLLRDSRSELVRVCLILYDNIVTDYP